MLTFVLRVTTGKEEAVKESLEAFPLMRSYHFWVPKKPIHMNKQGVQLLRHEVLFPGYVLADGEDFDDLYTRLLSFVSADFYTLLGKGEDDGKIVTEEEKELIGKLTAEVSYGILEGGRVRFTSGEMMGLEGFVQKFDKRKNNVMLRMEMLGKTVDIWTAVNMVETV